MLDICTKGVHWIILYTEKLSTKISTSWLVLHPLETTIYSVLFKINWYSNSENYSTSMAKKYYHTFRLDEVPVIVISGDFLRRH